MIIEAEVELVISNTSNIPISLFTQSSVINLWLFNSLRDSISHLQFPSAFRIIPYNIWLLLLYRVVFYTVIPLFLSDHHCKLGL